MGRGGTRPSFAALGRYSALFFLGNGAGATKPTAQGIGLLSTGLEYTFADPVQDSIGARIGFRYPVDLHTAGSKRLTEYKKHAKKMINTDPLAKYEEGNII